MTAKVRTCLWFDGNGEEAANFYVSLLPDSFVETVSRPNGTEALVVEFTLGGTPYMTLNGPPMFQFSEATSISVLTDDQQETDRLWNALTANGGVASRCGWVKDRFGLSWQVVPRAVPRLLNAPDKAGAKRVFDAMMEMGKIDIAALEAAAQGG